MCASVLPLQGSLDGRKNHSLTLKNFQAPGPGRRGRPARSNKRCVQKNTRVETSTPGKDPTQPPSHPAVMQATGEEANTLLLCCFLYGIVYTLYIMLHIYTHIYIYSLYKYILLYLILAIVKSCQFVLMTFTVSKGFSGLLFMTPLSISVSAVSCVDFYFPSLTFSSPSSASAS